MNILLFLWDVTLFISFILDEIAGVLGKGHFSKVLECRDR